MERTIEKNEMKSVEMEMRKRDANELQRARRQDGSADTGGVSGSEGWNIVLGRGSAEFPDFPEVQCTYQLSV